MIDRKLLREDSDYRTRIEAKRVSPELIDEFLSVDEKRTGLITTVEDLRSQKNAISKEIGQSAPEDRESKLADAAKLKDELEGLETQLTELEAQHRELILQIPNPIHESVPLGGEDDYEIIKTVGEQYSTPKMDHADYGEYMGWVLSEQGATVSGSRFAYLAGDAVRLEFALVQWTMSVLTEKGFTPVVPPVLVRESTMEEAGFSHGRKPGVSPRRRQLIFSRNIRSSFVGYSPRPNFYSRPTHEKIRWLLIMFPSRSRNVWKRYARNFSCASIR